jgi:iron complex transport system permease protein
VAAAGQVGFVGLVVPHLLRLLVGSSHRTLLPLSLLGGAVFVLGTDLAQVLVIGERPLRAGVLMSLLGGPFFLVLLVVHSRRRIGW